MKTNNYFACFSLLLVSIFSLPPATVHAQGTLFTYQGRVTDNGTNFTGTGQFEFALVTSTNANHTAMATANVPSGGYVTGYTVTGGGTGYVGSTAAMTITGGGGSGAAAHGNITGGAVTSITVDSPGIGRYTAAPTVLIAPPPANISYTTYWSNDGTSVNGSEPSVGISAAVANGLFTVVLGDATVPGMAAIPTSLFLQPNLQLRIWFNDGVRGFAVMDPAQNLTPVPYATYASSAAGLPGLTVQNNTNGAPNVIGGASVNYVVDGVVGATIAGGGATNYDNGLIFLTNSVTSDFGTVSGGGNNVADNAATVGGGFYNTANGVEATVSGGNNNTANGSRATVGGGGHNAAMNNWTTVGGGEDNTASGAWAIVGGGEGNIASGAWATVSGGDDNNASGEWATVGGGFANIAAGHNSFAIGSNAQAMHDGTFVWADPSGNYSSDRANQFKIRAAGGVQMDVSGSSGLNPAAVTINSTSANGIGILVNENSSDTAALFANGGTGDILKGFSGSGNTVFEVLNDGTVKSKNVTLTSDRNVKENFTSLDAQAVLAKVTSMPVTQWNYKTDKKNVQHIGPMAQDFHAAFDLNGGDDKHISVVDEGGVALAAIQGLNQKVQEELNRQNIENVKLKQQNDLLAEQLNKLEAIVKSLANNK